MKINFNKKISTSISVLILLALSFSSLYAINAIADGWRITNTTNTVYNTSGTCFRVTKSSGADVFIPSKTIGEWNSFVSNAANVGASLASCVTYVYNWRSYMPNGTPYDVNYNVTTHSPAAMWYAGANFCSREIVGNVWNNGNVGVADSYCGVNQYPPGNGCKWYYYNNPNGNPFHYSC